jgi:outer membrane protein TolC
MNNHKLAHLICRYLLIIVGFFSTPISSAQVLNELPLLEAYQLLENQYPSLQNQKILESIYQVDLQTLEKNKMPAIYLKADGRLQSESAQLDLEGGTKLPFEIDLPIYGLKAYVEGQYNLLDGGINDVQKRLKEIQLKSDLQQIEVEKFALRERVNYLFANILLLREQDANFKYSLEDIMGRKKHVDAGIKEGVILESESFKLAVTELEILALKDNLDFKVTGLINSLSQLLGFKISKEVQLVLPPLDDPVIIPSVNRPEEKAFKLQRESIIANELLVDAVRKPRLNAFAQLGTGYPNPLNFLDNNVAPYASAGLQFSWRISDWGSDQLKKEKLKLQAEKVTNAERTFHFNLTSAEASYLAEIKRLQSLIKKDENIATLQSQILTQIGMQLDEGVITASEYITQLNAELSSKQNILIHKAELINIQLEFYSSRGAF